MRLLLFGVCSMLILSLGCSPGGPERAAVSGTVKINGRPVSQGAINFFPTEGNKGPEAGTNIMDGQYKIDRATGPVLGKNRVELRGFENTGKTIQDPFGAPGTLIEERANIFPAEASTLVREVKRGNNTFDFDIATKK